MGRSIIQSFGFAIVWRGFLGYCNNLQRRPADRCVEKTFFWICELSCENFQEADHVGTVYNCFLVIVSEMQLTFSCAVTTETHVSEPRPVSLKFCVVRVAQIQLWPLVRRRYI